MVDFAQVEVASEAADLEVLVEEVLEVVEPEEAGRKILLIILTLWLL